MFKSEVYRATLNVALFWWVGLTAYSFFADGQGWTEGIYSWRYILFGISFSIIIVAGWSFLAIKNRTALVNETKAPEARGFGMKCTLGPIPAWLGIPEMASDKNIPGIPRIVIAAIATSGRQSPAFQSVAIDLLRILGKNLDAPASPYDTGHGNESLFEHTIRVTVKCLKDAANHEYRGLYSKTGRLIVGLRDSNYKFDPNDPLILLVALAHDIGKLDSYIRKNGKIVGMRRTHDTMSMIMLGRIPSVANLSFKDRQALFGAVGYYHSPQLLPLDSAGRARDDRTIALLELIRRCDIESSMEEDGFNIAKDANDIQIKTPQNKAISDDDIWNAFQSLLQEPGRVNGTSTKVTIGQKWETDIYFNEERTRRELLQVLGIPDPGKRGDGTYLLTIRLMSILLNKELLMNTFQGREYGPTRSLFEIKFFNRDTGDEVSHWKAAFILRPDNQMPFLSQMRSHVAMAVIQRPVMGSHSARNKKASDQPEQIDQPKQNLNQSAQGQGSSPFPTSNLAPATELQSSVESHPFTSDSTPTPDIIESSPFPSAITPEIKPEMQNAIGENPFPVANEIEYKSTTTHDDVVAITTDAVIASKDVVNTSEIDIPREDDDSAMLSMCDTQQDEKEAEERRKQYAEERKKEFQQQAESGLPPKQKHALKKLDNMIGGNALDQFILSSTPKKKKDTSIDVEAAYAHVIAIWNNGEGKLGKSFRVGEKNKKNLYVMKVWLTTNAKQFNWDEIIDRNLIPTNKEGDQLYLKFILPES